MLRWQGWQCGGLYFAMLLLAACSESPGQIDDRAIDLAQRAVERELSSGSALQFMATTYGLSPHGDLTVCGMAGAQGERIPYIVEFIGMKPTVTIGTASDPMLAKMFLEQIRADCSQDSSRRFNSALRSNPQSLRAKLG